MFYFEDFYTEKKMNYMIKQVNNFRFVYSYRINTPSDITMAFDKFEEESNSRIAILDKDLKMIIGGSDTIAFNSICNELINTQGLVDDVINKNKIVATKFSNSGVMRMGIVAPMSLNSTNDSIIVAVSSVQPINEAADVMLEFYKNILLAFLILGIILSLIYSKLISIPLLKITKVADKMSRLDFSESCEVKSSDELGNLASTLNFLSIKLKNSISELKEKNKTLTEEIEIERKTEKLRKDFITGVSHELKTPIGIIEGYAEGLKDGVVEGKDAEIYIDTIIEEARKMNDLVKNMLEVSKLESGLVILDIENFNILRMIKSLVNKQDINLKNKNLKVNINTTLPYINVQGDIFNIELVISNLLTNAIKYTPNNNNINIYFNEFENDIEISIENCGIYIEQRDLENIFAKFFKSDQSRNRNSRSSGLGLSIVKNILDLHKSTYSIDNSKNGVIFKFTLLKSND